MNWNIFKQWIFDKLYRKDITTHIDRLLEVQGVAGTWNYNEYMHGMYNGMILIRKCILDNDDVDFRSAPDKWLIDIKKYSAPPTVA